jgi:hypothetical protein
VAIGLSPGEDTGDVYPWLTAVSWQAAESVFYLSLRAKRSKRAVKNFKQLRDCFVAQIAPRNDNTGLFQQTVRRKGLPGITGNLV